MSELLLGVIVGVYLGGLVANELDLPKIPKSK
jgi:hypothetical protein